MSSSGTIQWLAAPEDQDYPAARSYLALMYEASKCDDLVARLQSQTSTTPFKAKDIFRASGLSLLGISNLHVEKDRQKVAAGKALSPLLLVRDTTHGRVIVADGYHRLCAVYGFDEDAVVPCRIV